MVLAPLLLTAPLSAAPTPAIALAAAVVTVGAQAAVVNVMSEPVAMPTLFAAITRKW